METLAEKLEKIARKYQQSLYAESHSDPKIFSRNMSIISDFLNSNEDEINSLMETTK